MEISAASIAGLAFSEGDQPGSPVGVYSLTPHGALNANYSISYVAGALIVVASPASNNPAGSNLSLVVSNQISGGTQLLISMPLSANGAEFGVQNLYTTISELSTDSASKDKVSCLKSAVQGDACKGALTIHGL